MPQSDLLLAGTLRQTVLVLEPGQARGLDRSCSLPRGSLERFSTDQELVVGFTGSETRSYQFT